MTKDALKGSTLDVGPLTSFAGRRNADPDALLNARAMAEGAPVIADLSFVDGAVVGYTTGNAKWLTREQLGIPAGVRITAGPESPSPILRLLADR